MNNDTMRGILRECGVSCEFIFTHNDALIELSGVSDESLTFDALSRLSTAFGTRSIDISCDTGCSSDPTHDRVIKIRNPRMP